jgi:hypothetical protein
LRRVAGLFHPTFLRTDGGHCCNSPGRVARDGS